MLFWHTLLCWVSVLSIHECLSGLLYMSDALATSKQQCKSTEGTFCKCLISAWAVSVPGRQGSRVTFRSLRSWGRSSGTNASAVKQPHIKEPGHFEVIKFSSRDTGCTFFPRRSFFSRRPQNTGRQRRGLFYCQNKTNKAVRYGNIFLKLSVELIVVFVYLSCSFYILLNGKWRPVSAGILVRDS